MPMTLKETNDYPDALLAPKYVHLVVGRDFQSDHAQVKSDTEKDEKGKPKLVNITVHEGELAQWAWRYDQKRLRSMLRSGALMLEAGAKPLDDEAAIAAHAPLPTIGDATEAPAVSTRKKKAPKEQ